MNGTVERTAPSGTSPAGCACAWPPLSLIGATVLDGAITPSLVTLRLGIGCDICLPAIEHIIRSVTP